MTIKATINLILDDEAANEIEAAGDGGEDELRREQIVARYLQRLGSEDLEDILLRIVDVEDLW